METMQKTNKTLFNQKKKKLCNRFVVCSTATHIQTLTHGHTTENPN